MHVNAALRALETAVDAEMADGGWWDRLSAPAKKAYLHLHPNSRLNQALQALPSSVSGAFSRLHRNTKKSVADWHAKPHEERVSEVRGHLKGAARHVAQQVVEHGKHEAHTYKGAGAAIAHLARGRSWASMHPHHKKALKTALVHAGLTAAGMALGDASGEGANIAHLAASFAAEHAHHAALLGAGEVALKSARHLAKKATAAVERKAGRAEEARLARQIAEALASSDMPIDEWISILSEVERGVKARIKKGAKK